MTELERSTMARVTWRLLPFLFLLYIINIVDRKVNVGFAKLRMLEDLGMERKGLRSRRRDVLSSPYAFCRNAEQSDLVASARGGGSRAS